MNRNLTIILGAVIVASMSIGLLFALTSLQGNDEVISPNCMTGEKYNEHLDFYNKECPVNFEELGYESSKECHTNEIALFDPRICR